jgi:hypothetical protein
VGRRAVALIALAFGMPWSEPARSAWAAAELDGDRRPDLLVGAPFAPARPGVVGGAAYVLRGTR